MRCTSDFYCKDTSKSPKLFSNYLFFNKFKGSLNKQEGVFLFGFKDLTFKFE